MFMICIVLTGDAVLTCVNAAFVKQGWRNQSGRIAQGKSERRPAKMEGPRRGGGLGSRPKKMYGERLGDGVEYHLMSPTPRR